MEGALPEVEGVSFTFTRRPEPVPGEFRPRWKAALILLALYYCGRGKAGASSINKLKILSWASRDAETQKALIRFLEGNPRPDDVLLRHEPALVRAINLCSGSGLIAREGESLSLTDAGVQLASVIGREANLMQEEMAFLQLIGKRLSEEKTKILTEP